MAAIVGEDCGYALSWKNSVGEREWMVCTTLYWVWGIGYWVWGNGIGYGVMVLGNGMG